MLGGVLARWCKWLEKNPTGPLAGRRVVCWPDCYSQRRKRSKKMLGGLEEWDMPYLDYLEQPGMAAMLGMRRYWLIWAVRSKSLVIPRPGHLAKDGYGIADVLVVILSRLPVFEGR